MAQVAGYKSKGGHGRLLQFLLGAIALLILLAPFLNASHVLAPRGLVRVLVVVGLFLGESWVAIFIHELGHAIAALLVGWRVHVFAVFPFAFQVRTKTFAPASRFATGDFGGFVLATPPVGADWRRGEKAFILGGAAANLISGALALAFVASGALGASGEAVVGTFAVLSLVVALLNLVPIWGPDTLRSDGAHFFDAVQGRRNEIIERLAWLFAMRVDGMKAADFDREIVRQIESDISDGKVPAVVFPLLHSYYLAMGDLTHAHAIIKRIVAVDDADWAKIEHAFLVAMVERNGLRALEIMDSVSPAARGGSYNYWRAMAVAREAAGDLEGARAAVESARMTATATKAPLDDQDWTLLDTVERGGEIRIFA